MVNLVHIMGFGVFLLLNPNTGITVESFKFKYGANFFRIVGYFFCLLVGMKFRGCAGFQFQ